MSKYIKPGSANPYSQKKDNNTRAGFQNKDRTSTTTTGAVGQFRSQVPQLGLGPRKTSYYYTGTYTYL